MADMESNTARFRIFDSVSQNIDNDLLNAELVPVQKRYAILVREEFSCLINSHEQGHEQLDSGKLNTGGHK